MGKNDPPASHLAAGLVAAGDVPTTGAVVVSLGMSTTKNIFNPWEALVVAAGNPKGLVMVNCAAAGQTSDAWKATGGEAWNNAAAELAAESLTGSDVDVVWAMLVTGTASDPQPTTSEDWDLVLVQINSHWPNVKQIFVDSYPYGGYHATATVEPGIWQGGQEVRDFVNSHLGETGPWVAWGPYLWANGANPREDGFLWNLSDYAADGMHLSTQGYDKAAAELDDFFSTKSFTTWY